MDNHKICVVKTLCLRDVGISKNTENIMNRKNYQRGSNEKDGDRQRNSETIQEQDIAISRTSYTT